MDAVLDVADEFKELGTGSRAGFFDEAAVFGGDAEAAVGMAFEAEFIEHRPDIASGGALEDAAGIGEVAGLFGPALGFGCLHLGADLGWIAFLEVEGGGKDDFGGVVLKDAVAVAEVGLVVGDGADFGIRGAGSTTSCQAGAWRSQVAVGLCALVWWMTGYGDH